MVKWRGWESGLQIRTESAGRGTVEKLDAWDGRSLCAATVMVCIALLGGCTKGVDRQVDIDAADFLIDSHYGGVPEDFPRDVPVYPGVRGVVPINKTGKRTLYASSKDGVAKVLAYYEGALKEKGWTQAGASNSSDGPAVVAYRKESRELTVCVGQGSWKGTSIILSLIDHGLL
jgi:hypothetical protein